MNNYDYAHFDDWTPMVVRWRDAHAATDAWVDVDTYSPVECIITTYGHLWKDCLEGHVSLAGSVDVEKSIAGDVNHIPNGMVIEMRVI